MLKSNNVLTWPPPIQVKKHPRAKHIKLRATSQYGLEMVVPKGFNIKEIPFILEQNRTWIEKQLLKIHLQLDNLRNPTLPESIEFPAIQQKWIIHYQSNLSPLKIIIRPHHELVLWGNFENKQFCKNLLIKWIKSLAQDHLLKLVDQISSEIALPYTKASIRNQKSRWGSCSSKKFLNFNFKLLFLPQELTKHIIIHELCHTKFLDHSKKFWDLVESFDIHWKQHRQMMRKADQFIPSWVDIDF